MPTVVGQTFDVVVVGAGPAGTTAAWALARTGLSVLVLEAEIVPRTKPCGGGVVRRAVARLPEGFVFDWEHHCTVAQLHLPRELLSFQVERSDGVVEMASRSALDAALLRAAADVGARLWSPCRAMRVRHVGSRVEVATPNGNLTTRYLVIADGALGPTARAAGWRMPLHTVPAAEWEIRPSAEAMARFAGVARFDIGELEPGYAWVFPKRDYLTVGVVCMRRGVQGIKTALKRYLERLELGPYEVLDQRGGLIPVMPRPEPLTRGRALLVGDAAGLADPLLAEGLSSALASGRAAAAAILSGRLDPWLVQGRYEAAIQRELLVELRWARWLSHLLYSWPAARAFVMQRFGQSLAEGMTDVIRGARSLRSYLASPASWARLLWRWP